MKNKTKITIENIQAAIVGYVRSGLTIPEIVKLSGVAAVDVEAVIIENRLTVNLEEKSWEIFPYHDLGRIYYSQRNSAKTIIDDWNKHQK